MSLPRTIRVPIEMFARKPLHWLTVCRRGTEIIITSNGKEKAMLLQTVQRRVKHNFDPGTFYVLSVDTCKETAMVRKMCECPIGEACRCFTQHVQEYPFSELRYVTI